MISSLTRPHATPEVIARSHGLAAPVGGWGFFQKRNAIIFPSLLHHPNNFFIPKQLQGGRASTCRAVPIIASPGVTGLRPWSSPCCTCGVQLPSGRPILALTELAPGRCGSPAGKRCEFLFSSQIKPASSVWVRKGEALEAVPGVAASSPACPAHQPAEVTSLPSHLTVSLTHSCPCSCCDLALLRCRDRHTAESESQVASGRPEASAGQQMLLAPSVSQDRSHRPQEYLFASWPQSQLGSLDAAAI